MTNPRNAIRMWFRRHPEWMLWAYFAFVVGYLIWFPLTIASACSP